MKAIIYQLTEMFFELNVISVPSCRCSRVYWSTIDARKRCVYTCRILVYRPPVVETVTDTLAPCEKNFTIAHNPSTISGWPQTLLTSVHFLNIILNRLVY